MTQAGSDSDRAIRIAPRFCGPPDSGNGGYVSGLLARYVPGAAEVTLRQPPPLDTPLTVDDSGDGCVRLLQGERLVAEAKPAALDMQAPAGPSFEEALAAAQHYSGFHTHAFPTCFVCGPQRREGDALRIFAGPVDGGTCVAAPWVPHASLANGSGVVASEYLWAALDCPGYFAFAAGETALLGRLSVRIDADVRPEDRCVIVGWRVGAEGRKRFTGTALYSQTSRLCAVGRATWITI